MKDCFCIERIAYNKFSGFSDLCYNIISYLMTNNENIWKLLKYNTPDALSRPNLSIQEKRALIFNGNNDSEDFKVYRSPFLDESFTKQTSQLRVYALTVLPDNRSLSTIDFAIDCLTHIKLVNLDGCKSRAELMVEEVLKTLNGQDINGVGKIFFDSRESSYDAARSSLFNNRYFFGFQIVISVKFGELEGYAYE